MTEAKRKELQQQLQNLETEINDSLESSDDTTNPISPDSSIGRLTRLDALQSQQMSFEARRRLKKRLKNVQKALQLMEDGKYGICMKCQDEIPVGRLESMPEARVCVDCASG